MIVTTTDGRGGYNTRQQHILTEGEDNEIGNNREPILGRDHDEESKNSFAFSDHHMDLVNG